jgi:membrane peptidoglycan carboxypeptidase
VNIDGEAMAVVGLVVSALAGAIGLQYRQRIEHDKEREKALHAEREQREKAHQAERDAMRTACDAEKEILRKAAADEKDARIEDARAYTALTLKLQETVINAVNESRASDLKVASEIGENTKATRELTGMLAGEPRQPAGPRRPMGSRP